LKLERKKAIAPEVADLNALQVFKGGFAQREVAPKGIAMGAPLGVAFPQI
jgi:hypothetical protein